MGGEDTMELETYGDKKPMQKIKEGLSTFWNKTIFSDMIKRKQEEKQIRNEARQEARQEVLVEAKSVLKEQYKKEEMDKLKGIKKPNETLQKLAAGFGTGTARIPSQPGTRNNNKYFDAISAPSGMLSNEKISQMMSLGNIKTDYSEKQAQKRGKKQGPLDSLNTEQRIKRII
jgi:hypothetical protein